MSSSERASSEEGRRNYYNAWNFQLSMQKTQPDDTVNSIFKKKFKHLGKEGDKAPELFKGTVSQDFLHAVFFIKTRLPAP